MCNITDKYYVGSTCEPRLARRLTKHVSDYKSWKEGKRHKISSFDVIENGNYQILLIENFPCKCKDELTSREGDVIRQSKLDCECERWSSICNLSKNTNLTVILHHQLFLM